MSRLTQVPSLSGSGFRLRGCHPLRPRFPAASANLLRSILRRSYNPGRCRNTAGLGSCAFARHYWRNHWVIFFSSGYLDVSVPRVSLPSKGMPDFSGGLPHSDIRGSMGICPYPRLFAACHVLRRLREPRHPSCALLSFLFDLGSSSVELYHAPSGNPPAMRGFV